MTVHPCECCSALPVIRGLVQRGWSRSDEAGNTIVWQIGCENGACLEQPACVGDPELYNGYTTVELAVEAWNRAN